MKNNTGFTLIELLTVVLIIGVLTAVALPNYMRSIERARATEAMAGLKVLNDAVYAYAAAGTGETACPTSFNKLVVNFPGTKNATGTTIRAKDFTFTLNAATNATIPGTDCGGVIAKREGGAKYDYILWNPYMRGTGGKGASLACTGTTKESIGVCQSLDLYQEGRKPY